MGTKKCKHCQSAIDAKAIKCPQCQSDLRIWPLRHPVLTIIIFLFFLGGIMSAIFNSTNNTSTNTPSATEDAYKTTATITKTLSPTPTPTPQTLLEVSGSGTKTTQAFTASGDWNMNWSYDCKNFGNQGNFQVYVYNQDGTDAYQDAGVNELGATGNDTEYYHNGGTFYLVVNSECSWNINVKG